MAYENDSESVISSVIKYLVFFFNFVFWLIGGAFIAIGIWAYTEKAKYDFNQPEESKRFEIFDLLLDLTILLIVAGVVIFIIAFAGCLGALRENVVLLMIFSYALAVLFLAEVVVGILAIVFSSEVKSQVTDVVQDEVIIRYLEPEFIDLHNLIDWVQETFSCCGVGVKSYGDWSLNLYFNCSQSNKSVWRCGVPASCCVEENDIVLDMVNTMCGLNKQGLSTVEASEEIYTTGCVQAMLDFAEKNMYIMGAVAIGLAVPQILGLVLGYVLIRHIKDIKKMYVARE